MALGEALLGLAGGAGPGGPPAPGPGGPAPLGAQPGVMPPAGGPMPESGAPQQQQDPGQLIHMGLLMLFYGMHTMGLTESGNKVVRIVQQAVERMTKDTPEGRQEAAYGGAMQQPMPPGVGPMPGSTVV